MKKRSIISGLVIAIFLIICISTVSAGIYFSQPETNYNLGDIINMSVDVTPLEEGPIEIDLICDSNSGLVFYTSAPTSNFKFQLPLTSLHIQDLTGDCYFKAEYRAEIYESRTFHISDKLNIELDKDSHFAKPGEEIIISGEAQRLNGIGINGDVSITIPLLKLTDQEIVEDYFDEEFEEQALDLSTNEWEKDDYEKIYNEISDIENKEDINYVEIKDDEIESVNSENKDAVVFQKIKVGYEIEGENETEEKIIYFGITTRIENEEIDSQSFSEVNEDYRDDENEEIIDVDHGMFVGKVVNGRFSVSFVLDKDTPSGDYRIDVLAYEENSFGDRTSEGLAMANLKISQVLTRIDIALDDIDFDPGEEFNFKPRLIDQAGFAIDDDVSVIIQNEYESRLFEDIVKSEETITYKIPTNLSSGYYEIKASSGEIMEIKKFYVQEKAMVSFEIINNTLIVTNIGNIPYRKDIQVELGGISFVKKLNLGLGETHRFELTGYDGEYDVWVSDGETEMTKTGVALTGKAINVKSLKQGILMLNTPIVWIFFIIILGAGILFLFRKVLKKKSFAYPFRELGNKRFHRKHKVMKVDAQGKVVKEEKPEEKSSEKTETKKAGKQEKQEETEKKTPQNRAEQVLVLKGRKNRATVIALKVKNKISKFAKKSLAKSIEHVYENKGAVYEQGDYIFIVFSPLMTHSFKNEVRAAKAAERMVLVLKEHNRKFQDKIEFGIGINSGNIISKFENKKLKFTALGNLIGPAKRLAVASKEQILVTKEAYDRGISEIKAQKKNIGKTEVYEVRKVIDKEKNKKFIEGFLKRMKDEKKK